MQAVARSAPVSRKLIWLSYLLSVVPVLMILLGGAMNLFKPAGVVEGYAHFGYAESVIVWIGIAQVGCAVLYLIPRTSVLGAILVTGFLGGATATHVRVGEAAFVLPVLFAMMAWGGLFLRDGRLRELIPFRR